MQDVCNLVTLSWYTVARILTDYNYIYKHFSYVSGISCIVAGIRTSVRTWLRTVSLVCWSSDHNIVCPEMYRKQIRTCLNGSWWWCDVCFTLYRILSHTQMMSTMTSFSTRGSRCSGNPCQKCSKKFWIWNIEMQQK